MHYELSRNALGVFMIPIMNANDKNTSESKKRQAIPKAGTSTSDLWLTNDEYNQTSPP